jgi:hypothetical protein
LFVTVLIFLPACGSLAVWQACTVTTFWLKNQVRTLRRVKQPAYIVGQSAVKPGNTTENKN